MKFGRIGEWLAGMGEVPVDESNEAMSRQELGRIITSPEVVDDFADSLVAIPRQREVLGEGA